MTPVVALLDYEGRPRMVCLGCSAILAEQGMITVEREACLNDRQPEYSVVTYKIAPGFTLDECRAAIQNRHTGPAWGS